ncbi:MAG: hypothetical protein ACRC8K_08125, partial [Waterburya sp.]
LMNRGIDWHIFKKYQLFPHIVRCAMDSGKDIVIITRDSDYGVVYKDHSYLNDWLKQEFKQRVSQKRKILLTHKLSIGLKIVHAAVTEEMIQAEQQLIDSQKLIDSQNSLIKERFPEYNSSFNSIIEATGEYSY